MIDIVERLRRYAGGMCISTPTEQEAADIIEGLRAELSTEKGWIEDYKKQIVGLQSRLEAAEKERDEIACVKEVEFPRKVQAVADAWKGKCERLEAQCDAAETEALEQARLNGMGSKREAALMAKLEAAEKERDALQAKVEMMEKQEPVAIVDYKRGSCIRWVEYLGWQKIKDGTKLYALPGAKGEEK